MKKKSFCRNKDVLATINAGEAEKLDRWLSQVYPRDSQYCIDADRVNKEFIVEVFGDLVLTDFAIEEELHGFSVRFGNVSGTISSLYEMTKEEVYSKIRDNYLAILANCLGKSQEDQEIYLLGEKRILEDGTSLRFSPGLIEASEDYISSLPDKASIEKMNDLVNQIISGILEYAYYAKDSFSVEMHQYARTLEKLL